MGYVFLAFSEAGRDFALQTRSYLEASRISTWLREPHLDGDTDQAMILAALQAASVMLVVWQKTSENTSFVVQLHRDLSQARKLNIPIVMLSTEDDFEPVLEKLKSMVTLQNGRSPLPIPMTIEDGEKIKAIVSDIQRPSPTRLMILLVAIISAIAVIGLVLVFQPSERLFTTLTTIPTYTVTASQVATSSPKLTPTNTITPISIPTLISTNPATFTPTFAPTRSASATQTATVTRTIAPTHTHIPTLVIRSVTETTPPISPFLTNTPSSTTQESG